MDNRYIPPLPLPIVKAGREYAKKEYNLDLDEDLLTELYWHIRWRREAVMRFRRRNRTAKPSPGFYVARDWVLDRKFPHRNHSRLEHRIRQAYSGALGKMANEFRKRSQPGFHLKRTELERIMDFVTLDKDRRQYRLIV